MTQAELFALMKRFEASSLAELRYSSGDESVLLCRSTAAAPVTAASGAVTGAVVPSAAAVPAPPPVQEGRVIKAPLVGTYYASPAPDAPPFAAVGKAFKKGETVAVIEAMKMINELPAPCDCVVEEIFAVNGALVGFNDPLLRISEK